MSTTKDRIELSEAILALIEKKRVQTGDETLGLAIEQVIIESQFEDLEHEILENPGAIENRVGQHCANGNDRRLAATQRRILRVVHQDGLDLRQPRESRNRVSVE